MRKVTQVVSALFRPNEKIERPQMALMVLFQVTCAFLVWVFWPSPMIPKPLDIFHGFVQLWTHFGLSHELMRSFLMNMEAVLVATVISLGLAYLTTLAFFRPLATVVSKFRFMSLVGLTFIFTLVTTNGHVLKLSLLVFGISVFYVTNMMQVVASVPNEKYNHAYTLGMGRWRAVWEVVVLGKMDETFEALRQNSAIGWMMLAFVEGVVRSEGGVGAMLLNQNKHLHLEEVFAIQFTILLLGLAQDYFWVTLKRRVCPWAYLGLERS